jgi:hypothetical protein
MEYVDKEGKELEISYSTEVQQKLEKTLRESIYWRKKMYHMLASFKWLAIIGLLVLVLVLLYLDRRDAVSIIARRVFCPGY